MNNVSMMARSPCETCHLRHRIGGVTTAWRPTEYLIEGELDNTTPGKVTGWMRFAGMKDKVTFDLNGNFHRDIRGAKIRLKGDGEEPDARAAENMKEPSRYAIDGILLESNEQGSGFVDQLSALSFQQMVRCGPEAPIRGPHLNGASRGCSDGRGSPSVLPPIALAGSYFFFLLSFTTTIRPSLLSHPGGGPARLPCSTIRGPSGPFTNATALSPCWFA